MRRWRGRCGRDVETKCSGCVAEVLWKWYCGSFSWRCSGSSLRCSCGGVEVSFEVWWEL